MAAILNKRFPGVLYNKSISFFNRLKSCDIHLGFHLPDNVRIQLVTKCQHSTLAFRAPDPITTAAENTGLKSAIRVLRVLGSYCLLWQGGHGFRQEIQVGELRRSAPDLGAI